MPERERVVRALAGKIFPRVGDTGQYCTTRAAVADTVIVTSVSTDGDTVTVRFLSANLHRQGTLLALRRASDDWRGMYTRTLDPQEWVIFT